MKPTNVDDSLTERRAEDEALHELIGGAGPRESVPDEDLTAIKRAALRQWNEVVVGEQRRMRRSHWRLTMAVAAGLTAVAMLVALWWNRSPTPLPGEPVAAIDVVVGQATVLNPAGSHAAAAGGELKAGDVVRTGDAPASASRVALRLDTGHSARLDRGTTVELRPGGLTLRQGAVYVDSGIHPERPIKIVTDWGVVREMGTQFEVRLDAESAALRVRVREGEVGVQAGAAVQTVAPGEELVIDRYGSGIRNTVAVIGDGWDWVLQVTPAPQIDGQTLREFLAWFRRETGLVSRYEDPVLAETAPGIEIHGSVSGLTPFEALEVVLAGSDLEYRVEGANLLIERP